MVLTGPDSTEGAVIGQAFEGRVVAAAPLQPVHKLPAGPGQHAIRAS